MSWREAGCYAWRGQKYNGRGRHFLYVGETGSRVHRDPQHLHGDAYYGAMPKPWSDLDPKVYPLPCFFPHNRAARRVQEFLWIMILFPAYNVVANRWRPNPRRITPWVAKAQRLERELRRRAENFR
jgi:hypothetical protein